MRRMAVAFLCAGAAGHQTGLERRSDQAEVGLGLAGNDARGRVAQVGAVEAQANAPDQLLDVRLAEIGVGAGRARGGAIDAIVDAAEKHLLIDAARPRMHLDDVLNAHVVSFCRPAMRSAGEGDLRI